jgi:Tol biopolymer transport system component
MGDELQLSNRDYRLVRVVWRAGCGFAVLILAVTCLMPGMGQALSVLPPMAFWVLHGEQRAIDLLDIERLLTVKLVNAPPMQVLYAPNMSRDGRRLAYDVTPDGRRQAVYVADIQGALLYRSPEGISERLPGISPDGHLLAFWSRRSGVWHAYIVDLDTGELRQLTQQPGQLPYDNPIWSPDGKRLALRFWRPGGDAGYFVVDLENGRLRYIRGFVDAGSDFVWSPDGQQILFRTARERNGEIYLYDLATDQVSNLTNDPATDFQPQWSPDGELIAFVSTRQGAGSIYLMNTDGSAVYPLYSEGGWGPLWSPYGGQIAFLSRKGDVQGVYVVDSACRSACEQAIKRVATTTQYNILLGWVSYN